METWKPGKRFPRFQVSRVPGFLGFQISRFPRFPGFSSDLRSNPDPSDLDLAPARPGNLETWKKVSRFPGFSGSQVSRFPGFLVFLDLYKTYINLYKLI